MFSPLYLSTLRFFYPLFFENILSGLLGNEENGVILPFMEKQRDPVSSPLCITPLGRDGSKNILLHIGCM